MEHAKAVETDAVGRYLVGEMDPSERDDFEEHYFTCAECGEELRLAAVFRANARQALNAAPRESPRRASFWRWLSAPVLAPAGIALALATLLIYQTAVTIPGLKKQTDIAQIVPAIVLHSASRGAEDAARVPAGAGPFTLNFDLPPGAAYPVYRYTVADPAGRTIDEITAGGRHDSATLLLQHSRFPPGRYNLTVRGLQDAHTDGPVLASFQFVVE